MINYKKTSITNKVLLSIIICLVLFLDKNLMFVFNIIAFVYLAINYKLKHIERNSIIILSIPLLIAFVNGVFQFSIYDVLRDSYYFLNPILFLGLGFLLARTFKFTMLLNLLIIVSTIFALIHVIVVFFHFGFSAFSDFRNVRYVVGNGNAITPIILGILFFTKFSFKIAFFKSTFKKYFIVFVNILSFLFSGSRTNWIVLIVLFLSLMYPKYKSKLILFTTCFILFVLGAFIFLENNSNNGFVKTILNSNAELSIGNYKDAADMNNKFRGWETYRTYNTYIDGNLMQIIFGHGAGKLVDLGTHFELNGNDVRFIPIVHNGYMFFLLKTGIFGVVIYIFCFFNMIIYSFKKGHSRLMINRFQVFLIIGLIFSLIITNYVIYAIINPSVEIFGVLVGVLLFNLERIKSFSTNKL